jgi:hypothetical protein
MPRHNKMGHLMAGRIGGFPGRMQGRRFAKSYWEEQEDLHNRRKKENEEWEKAKKRWKRGVA